MGLNDGGVVRFDGACTGCGIRGPAGRECTCGAQYHPDDDRFHYQGGEWRNGPNPGERDRGAQIRMSLLRAGDVHPHPGPVQVFESQDGAGQKCGHRNCEHDADGGMLYLTEQGVSWVLCPSCLDSAREKIKNGEFNMCAPNCEGCSGDGGEEEEARRARTDVRGKVVGEFWGGSFPFVRAAYQRYGTKCAYICVDKLGQNEIERKYAEWNLRELFALPNVLYVQHNCEDITSRDWNVWCGYFGRAMADTLGLEASIECTTWTLAAKATSSHRKANGAAISIEAQKASRALNGLMALVRRVLEAAPLALVAIESPWHGLMRRHRLVQEFVERGAWVCPADLCASYDHRVETRRDGTRFEYPQKRTGLTVFGLNPRKARFKRCKGRKCPMALKGTKSHKRVICNSVKLKPGQKKVDPALNAVLPTGLMHTVWKAHEQWKAEEDGYTKECARCAEEGDEPVALKCTRLGCFRAQHLRCATCRDLERWMCDVCYMNEQNAQKSKSEMMEWYKDGEDEEGGALDGGVAGIQKVVRANMVKGEIRYEVEWDRMVWNGMEWKPTNSWVSEGRFRSEEEIRLLREFNAEDNENEGSEEMSSEGSDNGMEPDTAEEEDETGPGVYLVEKILGKRKGSSGSTEYQVRWAGYDRHHDTWEDEEGLRDVNGRALEAVAKFEKSTKPGQELVLFRGQGAEDGREAHPAPAKPAKKRGRPRSRFVVEGIIGHRHTAEMGTEYLVEWEGYGSSENTWEPRQNLLNKRGHSKVIEEYEATQKRDDDV